MKDCQNCKHFNTSDNYEKHLGWCELSFPSWFYKAVQVDQYEVDRLTRNDDTCSFWEQAK